VNHVLYRTEIALSGIKPQPEHGILRGSSEKGGAGFGCAKSTGIIATTVFESRRDKTDAHIHE
jgi:hypothetical protein